MNNNVSRRDALRLGATAATLPAVAPVAAAAPAEAAAPAGAAGAAEPGARAVAPYVGAGSTAPVRPFRLREVRLGDGVFAAKRDLMLNFARQYDQRRFLVLFNRNAGRPNPPGVTVPGGWEDGGLLSGHWAGHFMTLLAQCHAATGEQVFADRLGWMVAELAACQEAIGAKGLSTHPGYLGAIPEDAVLRLGPPRFAVYGGDPNTNTWAAWYTQHKIMRGLLDAYTLTGNEGAFQVVRTMADWAHLALTLGDVRHPDYAGPITRDDLNFMWDTYIAGESGGANEVFAEMYALTGDGKHLDTARLFDNRESLFDACVNNKDILVTTDETRPGRRRPNALHANQHVPQFVGYLRIYERAGGGDYHTAAKNFFGMVVPHRMFAHGGTGSQFLPRPGGAAGNSNSELFQPSGDVGRNLLGGQYVTRGQTVTITGNGAEGCTTYNLVKLARNLFLHEQDPGYLDYCERALVNHVLGNRSDSTSVSNPQVTYFLPPFCGGGRSYGNTGTCDGGTAPESHTKHQESIYFRSADDSTLWVNLYIASTLDWADRGFTVTQRTDFPREQATRLTVDGSGPLTIKLRVPSWAGRGFTVKVNGAAHDTGRVGGPTGGYLTISRSWTPGDTVEISMPFSLRVERAIDEPSVQSLFYGPVLLPVLGDPIGEPPERRFIEFSFYKHLKRDGDLSRVVIPAGTVNHFTTHGRTLRPLYIGDTRNQHLYFRRVEPDVVFGSIGTGVANDAIRDEEGLTFLDRLWEGAPFATHGEFVRRAEEVTGDWLRADRHTSRQRRAILTAAASAEQELRP
jgi:DUF1680 family protein